MPTSPIHGASRFVAATLCGLLSLGVLSACSDSDSASVGAVDQPVPTPSSTVPPATPSSDPSSSSSKPDVSTVSCTSNYHAGNDSLDMIMQNNTGELLTLDPKRTNRGSGHWAARPPATLAAGDCAVINAYSDDDGLWVTAMYQLPDGTFVPFACEAADLSNPMVEGPAGCNSNTFTKMLHWGTVSGMTGTVSNAWTIANTASSGSSHTHWTLVAQPQ